MGSSLGLRPPRSGCTTTCSPLRLPTNLRASRGAYLLVVEPLKRASFRPSDHLRVAALLPAEVCERMRRDGGSVFPARVNTGDPNGPVEACPLIRSHAR